MSKSTRRPAGALPRGWRSLVKLLSLLAYFLSLGRVYSVLPGVFAELIFPIRWGIYTSGQRRMVTGLILHRAATSQLVASAKEKSQRCCICLVWVASTWISLGI